MSLNLKPKIIKTIALSSVLLSLPMWVMTAGAYDLIIKRENTDACGYDNFEVASDGSLILHLVNSNECNLVNAIKESATGTGIDSDEDGFSDLVELYAGTDTQDATKKPADLDGDGTPDAVDTDKDGDGIANATEVSAGSNPADPASVPGDINGNDIPDEDEEIEPQHSGPLVRELDILNKFNTSFPSYSNKNALAPQAVSIGGVTKKVYIVNQGNIATSVPSCVNGKDPQTNCQPTGWVMGAKKNEIYSVRLKTKADFSTARIRAEKNQKAGGAATNANYKYNISDKPGDMVGQPYNGAGITAGVNYCEKTTTDFSGSISIQSPDEQVGFDLHCDIPPNEVFYLNIELAPDAFAACTVAANGSTITDPQKTGICCDDQNTICSNYFITNTLAVPSALSQGLPQ